jgi:lipopolysaccharide biosynthesis regulator YciM
LAADTLVKAAQSARKTTEAELLLLAHYQRQPSIDVLEALTSLESPTDAHAPAARQHYLDHLQKHPSLIAATRWLGSATGEQTVPATVQKALEAATRPLARYRCAACGFEAKEHFWHCPGCQAWDSYPPRRVEEL